MAQVFFFLSEILMCVRSLDLISVVDLLIETKTFIDCLMLKEKLCVSMAKSVDSGPRLPWFKASLYYLLSWVTLGK